MTDYTGRDRYLIVNALATAIAVTKPSSDRDDMVHLFRALVQNGPSEEMFIQEVKLRRGRNPRMVDYTRGQPRIVSNNDPA